MKLSRTSRNVNVKKVKMEKTSGRTKLPENKDGLEKLQAKCFWFSI